MFFQQSILRSPHHQKQPTMAFATPVAIAAALMSAVLLLGVEAKSETTSIGGVELKLLPPPGHCPMDPRQPSDANVVGNVRKIIGNNQGRLLEIYANCDELQKWRGGQLRLLQNMAQYQVVTSTETRSGTSGDIKSACDAVRSVALKKDLTGMTQAVLGAVLKDVKVNEAPIIGVLAEDTTTCYYGQYLKSSTLGITIEQAQIAAITLVKNRIVLYSLVAPHGSKTYSELLALHQANIAALQAANN